MAGTLHWMRNRFSKNGKQSDTAPKTALVLSGGGARAAYQVGVLRGIARILPRESANPFPIITGTSAGALNAVSLATHAQRLRTGVRTLEYIWNNLDSSQVYRLDSAGLISSASNWVFSFLANRQRRTPVSLLDNSPLEDLLFKVLKLERIKLNMDAGLLDTVSVTASGYSRGESVSFFQSNQPLENWKRPHREGVRTDLSIRHLMASTAIPTLFPAVRIDQEYFGDGAIRQLSPLSPAIHLGAEKILVIGVGGLSNPARETTEDESLNHPSLSQIIGHVLNSAFVDTLDHDIGILRGYNELLSRCNHPDDLDMRYIELLDITPSQNLNAIAAEHYEEFPRALKMLIRDTRSSSILSLLLFEQAYCQRLMDLGVHDALNKKEEIKAFFGL